MSTPSEEKDFAAGTTTSPSASSSSSDGSIQSKPKVIMGDQVEYPSSAASPCSSSSGGNGVVLLQLASATKKKKRFEEEEEYGGVGGERLKRYRVSMVGRVCIPEAWGQESLLKDWGDLHAFENFIPDGLASSRKALVDDCRRRPNTSCRTSC